jgi:glycosyltransferase involved in cell wall biosynthesis
LAPVRRLLVVSYFHPPSPGIAGTRWESMARHLRALGHEVTVLASDAWGTRPDDREQGVVRVTDLRRSRALRSLFARGDLRDGLGPWSVDRPPRKLGFVVPDGNVVTWLPALAVAARRLLAEHRYDCLVTSSPPESSHLLGLLLGRDRPAWIADFRDGWTFEPPREPARLAALRRLETGLEGRVVRAADVTVTVAEPVAADFERRFGVHAELVPNGWDPELDPNSAPPAPRHAVRTLVHTGTLSGTFGRDPEPLLRALAVVGAEPGIPPLRLLHAGRLTAHDLDLLERSGAADAFEHAGTLDRSAALALQRSADALVLVTSRNTAELPGKLFEYLAAGRPIVALAAGNEAARVVEETGTGVAVPPDDVGAIAAALRRVAIGELERDYAPHGLERFTYPAPAERIAELVEVALARRSG